MPRNVGLDTFLAVEVEKLDIDDENETEAWFFFLDLGFPCATVIPSALTSSEPESWSSERSPDTTEL